MRDKDVEILLDALRTIAGPSDSAPYIWVYRDAGGGYEGLQAIAKAALQQIGDRP